MGAALMWFALIGTVTSVIALVWGRMAGDREGESATNLGYVATFVVAAVYTLATVLLTVAFLRDDLSFMYVAQYHPNVAGPWGWLYRFSGVWAGPAGSFFFWAWLISLFNAWIAYKRIAFTDALTNVALAVSNTVLALFNVLLLTPSTNPFQRAVVNGTFVSDPVTGMGFDAADKFMSPLLQTWAMIIHPPTTFIGYAGLTIPFAYAVAALIVGDPSKRWVELCDRIAVFSWLMLGIGIGLGSVWAYYELAFGGFWAWDPVENASLVPWLTGVGLLHSFTVYRRRDSFKGWAVILASLTFAFVILATFIVRSGALAEGSSVHVFGGDPWMKNVLGFMILAAIFGPIAGLLARRRTFHSEAGFEGLLAKEYSYEINNVIMLSSAVLVAYMTLTSAIPAGVPLPAAGKVIGRDTYDLLARPIGVLYILLMTVCPILSWKSTDGATFWRRARWPLAGAGVLGAGFLALWWFRFYPVWARELPSGVPGWHAGPLAVLGFLVAAWAIVLPLWLFVDGARRKASASGTGFGSALWSILTKARTQSGGYITHFGMGLILFGLLGSTMYVDVAPQNFTQGGSERIDVGEYSFTLTGTRQETLPNGDLMLSADLAMTKDGAAAGTVSPAQILPKQYIEDTGGDTNQGRKHAYIIQGVYQDVFVTLQSVQQGLVAVDVKLFPLIFWVWLGFGVTVVGSGLAMWPKAAPSAESPAGPATAGRPGRKRK